MRRRRARGFEAPAELLDLALRIDATPNGRIVLRLLADVEGTELLPLFEGVIGSYAHAPAGEAPLWQYLGTLPRALGEASARGEHLTEAQVRWIERTKTHPSPPGPRRGHR